MKEEEIIETAVLVENQNERRIHVDRTKIDVQVHSFSIVVVKNTTLVPNLFH